MVVNTQSVLRVTTKNGKLIYEHIFSTSDLTNGYATYKIKNNQDKAEYVLKQAKAILGNSLAQYDELPDSYFIKQAPNEDFENYEAFKEFKNSGRVLFTYILNEESGHYLVYSRKFKKVVSIVDCC